MHFALLVVVAAGLAPAVPAQAPDARPPSPPESAAAAPAAAAPRPRATPTPAPVVEGIVRSADGKPVEKALVIVQPVRFGPGALPRTARTDAAGAFRVPLNAGGVHRVRVEAAGWAPATVENVRPGAPFKVSLRKGVAIEGTVRDAASGAPIPGAVVEARDDRYRVGPVWEPGAGYVTATTDAEGRFRIDGLAEGLHSVSARVRGYARGGRNNVVAGRRVDIVLLPGSALSGTVRDAQGRPVAHAGVRVEGDRRAGPGGSVIATDAEGRFEATGLSGGEYRVIARHPSFAPAWLGGVALEKGADASLDIVLHTGAPVTGRLVAGEDEPVKGRVALQETDGHQAPWGLDDVLSADAGDGGRFKVTLPPGAHALAVTAPGYAARRVEVDVGTGGSPVDVGDVTLQTGLVVRGRVRDRTGAPIADAQVLAFPNRGVTLGGGPMSHGRVHTESDGTFVVAGLGPGTYRVSVSATGFAQTMRPVDAAPSPGAVVDIVLDRAGAISGMVVDEAGQPIESFRVAARQVEQGPMSGSIRPGDTFAAADGRFVLEDIPDGKWVVEASAPDRADAVVSGVVVTGGGTTDIGRVRLGPGGTVRGMVVDGGGAPVGGASIEVVGAGRDFAFPRGGDTVSDPGGVFELRGLESGTHELVATHPGYAEGRAGGVEVVPARGPSEVRIVMTQGGRIEGRMARRDGSGLTGTIQVQLAGPGIRGFSSGPSAQVGPDGTFAVEHVPAGRVIVYAMGAGGTGGVIESRQSRDVEVREGETTTVEFISREILVTGHVTRDGAPASGLRLRLMGSGGSRMMMSGAGMGVVPAPPSGPQRLTGLTDETGAFALIVDEPGTYRVLTSTDDGRITFPMRTVEIPDADAHAVDLAFAGVPVTGVVVDKDTEQPVPAAHVSARLHTSTPANPMSGAGSAAAGADGRFALELEPGEYRVQAYAPGYASDTQEVSVAAGGATQELRLTLSRGATISGQVVDAGGRPVGGVHIGALTAEGDGGSGAQSLPDGSFQIAGLTAGAYTLSAHSALGLFAVRGGVATGETGVTLTLRPGGTVHLQVYGPTGAPVERASVRVSRVGGARAMLMMGAMTSPAGIAELAAPAGDVELEVGRDKLRGKVNVSVPSGGATTAEVTLAEADGAGSR